MCAIIGTHHMIVYMQVVHFKRDDVTGLTTSLHPGWKFSGLNTSSDSRYHVIKFGASQIKDWSGGQFPASMRCFGNNIFANTSTKNMGIQQPSLLTTRQCQCSHMNTIMSNVSFRILDNHSLQFAPRKTQIRLMNVLWRLTKTLRWRAGGGG